MLFYGNRYHKSQAIYLESKDNTKISCVISSVGTNEVSFSSRLHRAVYWYFGEMRDSLLAGWFSSTSFFAIWCISGSCVHKLVFDHSFHRCIPTVGSVKNQDGCLCYKNLYFCQHQPPTSVLSICCIRISDHRSQQMSRNLHVMATQIFHLGFNLTVVH